MRSRFLWRMQAAWAAFVLALVAVVALATTHRQEEALRADLEASLRSQVAILRELALPALAAGGDPRLTEDLRRAESLGGTRLTVIAADGRVLGDSEADPAVMENHLLRPEVQQALHSGWGSSTRFSRSVQREMTYVADAVAGADGRPLGFVRASLPVADARARVHSLRVKVALGAFAAAIAGIAAGMVFARRIASPLLSVTAAAESLAAGRYRPAETGSDTVEVTRLTTAFNRVAEDLRSRVETIASERNRLVAILAAMVEGVIAVDRDQGVSHVNGAAAEILQLATGDPAGRPLWEVTRVPAVLSAVAEALERKADVTAETRLVVRGRDAVVRLRCSPLLDAQGVAAGAVLVLHDVTELRRLETVRRDFVANVSHELKTPLTAITGMVETILDDEAMDPETRTRFLRRIGEHASRLGALVRDLLVLARVESAEEALDMQRLDLREIARQAAARFGPEAQGRGVSLATSLPGDAVAVSGDEEALREVVDNLVDNALKFTPAGGSVSLEAQSAGGVAEIAVRDTGIGIEAAHLPRLFERFYRVDKARSRELGGTGLGLAIVKHFVQAHGGTVSVESSPGRGSTFRVRLPLVGP